MWDSWSAIWERGFVWDWDERGAVAVRVGGLEIVRIRDAYARKIRRCDKGLSVRWFGVGYDEVG